jgi:pimeloyl-ACP methyl ester carboxylesterase
VEAGEIASPAVVLLAGWGCSAYLYRKNLQPLADAGFRAIAVELKGQGESDKPLGTGEYTLDSLAEHTLDVLDALALPSTMLVGLSLGGGVAARVALRAPERVHKLALLAAVGLGPVRLARWARFFPAAIGAALPPLTRRWMFRVALRAAYGTLDSPTEHDVDEYFPPARDPAFVRTLWALLREVDWRELTPTAVRRLTMPLLAVFGTHDRIISPHRVEQVLGEAPRARIVRIPGAGHAIAEEAPEAVNRLLIEFLAV